MPDEYAPQLTKSLSALVTGASRGISRASALALAAAGAQVLVHYGSSEKEAAAVVAVIRKAGGKAEKVGADLRRPKVRTRWPGRSAPSSATASTSWSPTPVSPTRLRGALRAAVSAIKEHLAFYPDRVDAIQLAAGG